MRVRTSHICSRHRTTFGRCLALASLSIALLGCTVTLVSRYDEVFDRSATALQREMDEFLTNLELASPTSEEASYTHNAKFYAEYAVEVRGLLIRARSLPKNDHTAQQVELMLRSVEDLRSTHEAQGHLSTGYIGVTRNSLNQSWQAIIALELAKKR